MSIQRTHRHHSTSHEPSKLPSKVPARGNSGIQAIMQLQQSLGNRALANLLRQPIQRQTSGQPLPNPLQTQMESAFNTDFSAVRIHESPHAAELGALAFTQGSEIHFAPGQYRPDDRAGQQLIGHELTHVVQQRQGRVQPTASIQGILLNDSPALENEAEQMGRQAANAHLPEGSR